MSSEKHLLLQKLEETMQKLYTSDSYPERVAAGIRCDQLEAALADLDYSPST